MLSLRGIYENGKITLLTGDKQKLPENSNIILTFMAGTPAQKISQDFQGDKNDEEYYKSIRQFERTKAHGNITVIDKDERYTFTLNDYSQGGLSFIADIEFVVGSHISAGITDPTNPEMVLMELEMEVRGVFPEEDSYKIGCMFLDSVDEDLWHGLLQYLD